MMVRYLLSFYLSAWLLALSDGQIEFSGDDRKAGLIILHGLGVSMGPDLLCEAFARSRFGLGLSENTIVRCPAAARKPVGVIPATFVPGLNFARSWFDFFMMPALSVMSSTGGENKDDLDAALEIVEDEIRVLVDEDVPSRNIVIAGLSQGGALTLYTAIHTKYVLGGFVPIVTWLPLLRAEPPDSLSFWPVNRHTPILHMNGALDTIVTLLAGRATEEAMSF